MTSYRVRHKENGNTGTLGDELALTGPAMGVRIVRWDNGTSEFFSAGDNRIEIIND